MGVWPSGCWTPQISPHPMNNRTFLWITSWDAARYRRQRRRLFQLGVSLSQIGRITERVSRPVNMNWAWASTTTEFVGFVDDDADLGDRPFLAPMEAMLETHPVIGMVIMPTVQVGEKGCLTKTPDLPVTASAQDAALPVTTLTTLGCCLLRRSVPVRFDEAYFGSQVFDRDFGRDVAFHGWQVVADRRFLLGDRVTHYPAKSLFYHTMVCRNLQIYAAKWTNRRTWHGVHPWNAHHPKREQIPSLEECSFWTEEQTIRYCARWDQNSVRAFWWNPRFTDAVQLPAWFRRYEELL